MIFGLFIVLLILIIAVLGYRMLNKPIHERIINKLGNGLWLVDKTGVGEGASFYIKFGEFKHLEAVVPSGTVQFTKYGMDKAFEYDASLDWSQSGDSLRVGQMKLTLVYPEGGTKAPVIMYTNNVEGVDSWTAPIREVDPPGKKL